MTTVFSSCGFTQLWSFSDQKDCIETIFWDSFSGDAFSPRNYTSLWFVPILSQELYFFLSLNGYYLFSPRNYTSQKIIGNWRICSILLVHANIVNYNLRSIEFCKQKWPRNKQHPCNRIFHECLPMINTWKRFMRE